MISFDTNILFPVCNKLSEHHEQAYGLMIKYADNSEVCLCEQTLMELYCLLRNPSILKKPKSANEAVHIIQTFRSNAKWQMIDFIHSAKTMDLVWQQAGENQFAFRKIFDCRLAMTLKQHHVTEFATRNIKDFKDQGFEKVWDPFMT